MRVLLSCCVSACLAGATATPFDGPPISGPSATWAGPAIQIGTTRLLLTDCDTLRLQDGEGPARPAAGHGPHRGIWLVDGSYLPVESLGAGASDDAVQVAGPYGSFTLPLVAVLGWGDHLAPAPADGQDWLQVAAGPMPGKVQGIQQGKLLVATSLSPDGKPLALGLSDVTACRLAVTPAASHGVVLVATPDPDAPPVRLLPQPGLPLACAPQVKTDAVFAAELLRVEGGRRVYLSSLTPSQVSEQGAFDVTWHWTRDTALDGSPLRLGGVRYAHGVSCHSRATLAWDLGGAYLRLHTLLGIADQVRPEGDCSVSLSGDGHVLWSRQSVTGTQQPVPLDLDVHGVHTLQLQVDYGARYDIGDHVALADAWLLRAP